MRLQAPLSLALVAAIALGGCYFTRSPSRPLPGLAFLRDGDVRQRCLVVFVPGFLDGPDTYREHRFPDEVLRSGAACDSVAVDLHMRYYAEPGVADVLYEDIIAPAIARGYEDIWLVGISMGGLGATLLARQHPEAIDGLILLSPYLGDPSVARRIDEAGGLAEWTPGELPAQMNEENFTVFLWAWLRGLIEDPDAMPPIFLGWAEGEQLAPVARVLGAALPEGHTLTVEGDHNWATWRPIFRELLSRARIGLGHSQSVLAGR
ncbi:MAG: alpha/beta hydrolase [Myxococcota bacterium]|nr:alpha/beta hydrolase [Myxococcota bacterium]